MSDPQNPTHEPTGDAANVPPAPATPSSDVPPAASESVTPPPASTPPAADAAPAYTPPAPEAAPAYAAPAYQAAPAYAGGAPTPGAPVPGKTLGIVALVVVFFASLVGLILGYVAKSQSKKAGVPNTPATVAIILGWIFLVLTIIGVIIFFVLVGAGLNAYSELCSELGTGVWEANGTTITCD